MEFAVLLLVERPGPHIDALVESLEAGGLAAIYGIALKDQAGTGPTNTRSPVSLPREAALQALPAQPDKAAAAAYGLEAVYSREKSCQSILLVDTTRHYRAEDILAILQAALARPGRLVVGERSPDRQSPFIARLVDGLSRQLTRLFMGVPLSDLRSGLLAIPTRAVPALVRWTAQLRDSSRGEFELELILACKRSGFPIYGHLIQSGAASRVPASHVILNSMSLYFVLARYVSSSLLTAVVDNLVFLLSYPWIHNLLVCIYLARLVAILVNYFLLRKVVFFSSDKTTRTFPKYIALVLFSGLVASLLINFFTTEFHTGVLLNKIMAELLLYFINFTVFNKMVFVHRQPLD